MKTLYFMALLCLGFNSLFSQVGIGTNTPDNSTILQLDSSNKGFLLSRLTSDQRNNIEKPSHGLMIFNIETNFIEIYDGVDWNQIHMEKVINQNINNELLNPNFELWTNLQLEIWSYDEGITVEEETKIIYSGTKSAKIILNTKDQSITDFRQTVELEEGEYEISLFVYHLDSGARLRLFSDEFKNYSSSELINQWQKVVATHVVTTKKNIEIGVRSYDTNNFNDKSIFYIDDFKIIKK